MTHYHEGQEGAEGYRQKDDYPFSKSQKPAYLKHTGPPAPQEAGLIAPGAGQQPHEQHQEIEDDQHHQGNEKEERHPGMGQVSLVIVEGVSEAGEQQGMGKLLV